MNLPFEDIIKEIMNAIQNEYTYFSTNHYNKILHLLKNVFNSITSHGKICKFIDKFSTAARQYYNIIMPYIITFLSKHTKFTVVYVFETYYELNTFRQDVKNIKNKLIIENNPEFKIIFTTIQRVRQHCIGLSPDLVIGWMPSGNVFVKNLKESMIPIFRFNVFLVMIGSDYLDCEQIEERLNVILCNGFKIRQ